MATDQKCASITNLAEFLASQLSAICIEPHEKDALQNFQRILVIENNQLTEDSLTACCQTFSTENEKWERQRDLLEFALGKLALYGVRSAVPPTRTTIHAEKNQLAHCIYDPQFISMRLKRISLSRFRALSDDAKFVILVIRFIINERVLRLKTLKDLLGKVPRTKIGTQTALICNSELVIISPETDDLYSDFCQSKNILSLSKFSRFFVKCFGEPAISVSEVIRIAKTDSYLQMPVLQQLLSGVIDSVDLPAERWATLECRTCPNLSSLSAEPPELIKPLAARAQRALFAALQQTDELVVKEQCNQLRNLFKAVTGIHKKTALRSEQAKVLLEQVITVEFVTTHPWISLFAQWGCQLLLRGGVSGKALRTSTVKRYLMIARPILVVLNASASAPKTSKDWELLLQKAYDISEGVAQPAAMWSFAEFLRSSLTVPNLSMDQLAFASDGVTVDANFFSPHEIEAVTNELLSRNDLVSIQALLMLWLGVGCGLRRAEVMNLPVAGICRAKNIYVSIRTLSDFSLKSEAARRNVPIGLLWPEQVITVLCSYVQQQEANLCQLMFDDENTAEQAMNMLTAMLRSISMSEEVRFHHCRHTFANWMFWLINYPYLDLSRAPKCFWHDWLDQNSSERVIKRLKLAVCDRRGMFNLAELMGHSHPNTTFQSYIHIANIVGRLYDNLEQKTQLQSHQKVKKLISQPRQKLLRLCKPQRSVKLPDAPLEEIGKALLLLSGTRFKKDAAVQNTGLTSRINAVLTSQGLSDKIQRIFLQVLRKKVPHREFLPFLSVLASLDKNQWEQHFTKTDVVSLCEMTDPYDSFLLYCRSIEQVKLLERWFNLLNFGDDVSIQYRVRFHQKGNTSLIDSSSDDVVGQIRELVHQQWLSGELSNFDARRGVTANVTASKIHLSNLDSTKCFICEVHILWHTEKKSRPTRDQLFIGILKCMMISILMAESVSVGSA